jgi:hypothetical protein
MGIEERCFMRAMASAFALTLLMAGTAHAQLIPCKTFDRSDATPQFVRDYLDRFKGPFVRACGGGDHPQYSGASSVVRRGAVCRYADYELNLSQTDPPRLERGALPPQTYMLVTQSVCPSPLSTNYAATNDVPQSVFEPLIAVWRDAASSPQAFDKAFSGTSDAVVFRRLRDLIVKGKRPAVVMVMMNRDMGVWKRYRVEIADPEHRGEFYAASVSSWFGRFYEVSGLSVGMY